MPERKIGKDPSLFVLKPEGGNPRLRLRKLVAGRDRRRRKAEHEADEQLVRETFGQKPKKLTKKP